MRKLMCCLTSVMVLVVVLSFPIGVAQAGPCELPEFALATFNAPLDIDNPYMPWVPRTLFKYEPVPNPDNVVNWVYVDSPDLTNPDTYKEITVGGTTINCLQVHDAVVVDGVLSEDTLDWYAQDDEGNVWYCGEDTKEYDSDGNISTEGSWEAGQDISGIGESASPGIIMPADPKSGECDYQEFYEGEAEDWGKVMRLNAKVSLQNEDPYEDCLETKEGSTSELGDIEQKFYFKDLGMVLNFEHHGKRVRWELISVENNVAPPVLPPPPTP